MLYRVSRKISPFRIVCAVSVYSSIGLAGKISTVFHTVCAVRLAGKSLFRPVFAAVYRVSSKISPFSSNQPMCVYTRIRSICAIALSISKSFEIISLHHFEQIRNLFRATLALWSHKHGDGKRVVIRLLLAALRYFVHWRSVKMFCRNGNSFHWNLYCVFSLGLEF